MSEITELKKRSNVKARPPRPGQLFVGIPELAWLLGVSYDWLSRGPRRSRKRSDAKTHLQILIDEYGFPAPRPFPGQQHYSLPAVTAWINGQPLHVQPAKPGQNEPDYDAMLAARNERIAGNAA